MPKNRRVLPISLLALILLAVMAISPRTGLAAGSIDLTSRAWGQGSIFTLDGEWAFSRGVFLDPAAPEADPRGADVGFQVPGFWNDAPLDQAVFGFGTLHTRVKVPPGQALYLALSDVPAAYRLYINGELATAVGQPATTRSGEQPQFLPRVVEIPPTDGDLSLVIHLSNFHYKQGGVRRSIQITDASGVQWLREWPMLFDFFFSGVLVTIGVVLIGQRWMDSGARPAAYFGLFCLVIGSRALLVGERILYQVDWLPWSILQKAEHVLLYLGMASFVYYLHELMGARGDRWFVRGVVGYCTLLTAFTVFLPIPVGTLTVVPFKISALLAMVFVYFRYLPVLQRKGGAYHWFRASLVVFVAALVLDLGMNHWQIHNRPIVHWGMVLFVILQAIYLWQLHVARLKRHQVAAAALATATSPAQAPQPAPLVEGLIRELGGSRERIRNPESRLHESQPAFDGGAVVNTGIMAETSAEQRREQLVMLLRLSLHLWERHSSRDKMALAEGSGCWRVYLDGSTPKTRTLDKYLSPRTLPKNPRWRLVVRTAHYVTVNCPLSPTEQAQLDNLIFKVESAFA